MNDHEVSGIGAKLRLARKNKNLSLRELAARAEVSPSLLSQIENGRSNPSVLALYNIAGALEVPITYFLPGPTDSTPTPQPARMVRTDKTASEIRTGDISVLPIPEIPGLADMVLKPEERVALELRGGVSWQRLTPSEEDNMQFLEIAYKPGASSGSAMSHHIGTEFGLILEGELKLELGFEQYTLAEGDTIIFDSSRPHRLSNETEQTVRAIWILWNRGESPDV